jgi:hypothetical protein
MTGVRQSSTIARQRWRRLTLSSLSIADYQTGSRIDAVVEADII